MTTLNFTVQPDGKLNDSSRRIAASRIADFAGKWITITIAERKDKRSTDQNAYYWSVVVPHVRAFRLEMGDAVTLDQTHEDLLAEFAPITETKRLAGGNSARAIRSKEMNIW